MIVERFFTPELAQVAYAVGNQAEGKVALIDPRRDVGDYLEWARLRHITIVAILETHIHADFVSGAPELARATGAKVYTSRLGRQEFDHVPVDDGWTLEIGTTCLTALHTPGHTPEHISWLAQDTRYPDAVRVLFSGDALFVGDVGRPDLLGDDQTDTLVASLFNTIQTVFRRLPDETMVYPGHTAGSSCGKNIGSDPHTTIGRERTMNYAFRPRTLETFTEAILRDMPAPPTYYPTLKRINQLGARMIASLPPMRSLSPDAVDDALAGKALIVDVRSWQQFSAGHVPGAVSVPLSDSLTTWMGWLAPYGRDVILVADDEAQAKRALGMLRRIGIDRVPGYLMGLDSWEASGRELVSLESISPDELRAERAGGVRAPVVDVRSAAEFEMGHVDDAVHHFLGEIAQGKLPALDTAEDVVVMCASGYRSAIAASLLQAGGFTNVRNLAGGMNAWSERESGIRSIAS